MTTEQTNLFDHAPYQNPGADGLPLITDSATGSILVYTPGHLYKPSPVEVEGIGKAASPGALIKSEVAFIARLIHFIDPDHAKDEHVIQRIPAAIKRKQLHYYLLRNLDRAPEGARFRLAGEHWFYPDFIFWIIDKATQPELQRLCYLDPKGLEMGLRGGWNHPKLLCFVYKLVEIASQIPTACTQDGQPVQFILKGALISTTTYQALAESTASSQEFHVYNDAGHKIFPSAAEFANGGIFFAEKPDHLQRLMNHLTAGESVIDQVMGYAVRANTLPETAIPDHEIGCFFRYLLRQTQQNLAAALGELLRHALTANDVNQVVSRLQAESRKQLQPYLKKGMMQKLTGGMEDVNGIAQPCRELLQRYP